jgi:4-hydroxymandelate oxidase
VTPAAEPATEPPTEPAAEPAAAGSIPELLSLARRTMRPEVFDYIELGAGAESTAQRNRQAFGRWEFRPRMLSGLALPDTSTVLGAIPLSLPVITAPFGNDGWIHPDGHLAVARAVHRVGTVNVAPHGSSHSLEDIARAADGSQGMFQLGLNRSEDETLAMADRAAAAGYRYLLFTHLPTRAWRERIYEHRLDLTPYSRANDPVDSPAMDAPDAERAEAARRWDWDRFAALAARCPLPWFLKGIQQVEDARRALDCGAAGLYVSNYGGRNLDCVPASIDQLGAIADEAAGRVPIVFDSGIRRGTDVVKALALGATAVAVGRLTAFAVGAGGEPAVARMLELLRAEIVAVLAELGVARVQELGSRHLTRTDGFTFAPLEHRNREI